MIKNTLKMESVSVLQDIKNTANSLQLKHNDAVHEQGADDRTGCPETEPQLTKLSI